MAYKKRIPTIVSAYATAGTYEDKDGNEQSYEGGVIFLLYYEEGSKFPAYGGYKKATKEAILDLKGQTFPVVNPRMFEDKYGRVVGVKIS